MIHDNQQLNANDIAAIKETFGEFDKLSAECMDWERTEYKSVTDRLYRLLAEIYSVYEARFLKVSNEKRRTLRNHLVDKLSSSGMQVRKSSDTLGLLIRYIFKTDRRRVMDYKNAIAAAKSNDILPAGLVQWLINEGGIDKVSKKVPKDEKAEERKKVAAKAFNSVVKNMHDAYQVPIATVDLQCDADGSEVLMWAKRTNNCQFNIIYVFDNPGDGVKHTLIRKAAAKNLKDQDENKAVADEAMAFAKHAPIKKAELAITA